MKKSDRIARMMEKEACLAQYELEERALEAFFVAFKNAMPAHLAQKHYDEAEKYAGKTFHIFERLIGVLIMEKTPITPALRRTIDAALEACNIERKQWPALASLCYDQYWREQYGYN